MSQNYNCNRIQLMNGANSRASCTHPEPNHHHHHHNNNSHNDNNNNNADYYDNQLAQQAATEATLISRSTLETTLAQGEQLQHCDNLRIQNEYMMKKSDRLVRGMTWKGWMQNLFTKDIQPPPLQKSMKRQRGAGTPGGGVGGGATYDDNNETKKQEESFLFMDTIDLQKVPHSLLKQASLITNYQSNVVLLCQNQNTLPREEYKTCMDICDTLRDSTEQSFMEWRRCQNNNHSSSSDAVSGGAMNHDLYENEMELKEIMEWRGKLLLLFEEIQKIHWNMSNVEETRQMGQSNSNQQHNQQQQQQQQERSDSFLHFIRRQKSPPSSIEKEHNDNENENHSNLQLETKYKAQEEHLDTLSNNLQELLFNTSSLNVSITEQNELLDQLHNGMDDLVESTKMVTRKADRIQSRSVSGYT